MLENEIVVKRLRDLAHLNETKIFQNTGIGVVKERGGKIGEVAIGDKIIWVGIPSNDEILVPQNLFGRIPDGSEDRKVVFAGIGAFIIQAIRQSGLTFGERVAVLGEGMLKCLVSQMLGFFGIRVLEPASFSPGEEIDGIFICPGSKEDVNSLTPLLRNQGTIILLTEEPLGLSPRRWQEKRLRLVFPEPPQPETRNVCYPTAFMRWTIKKDLELSLKLLGKISLEIENEKDK